MWSYQCKCKQGFIGDGYSCVKTCDVPCGNGYCLLVLFNWNSILEISTSFQPIFFSESDLHQCICDLGWTSSNLESSNCTVDCLCNFQSTCNLRPGQSLDIHYSHYHHPLNYSRSLWLMS